MATATIKYDATIGKYVAIHKGQVVMKGASADNIRFRIRNYPTAKTLSLGIDDAEITPSVHVGPHSEPETINVRVPRIVPTTTFPVNKRFEFLADFTEMVATGKIPSLIVTGESGLGKTYTVMNKMQEMEMENISTVNAIQDGYADGDYVVIKGHMTPGGLYEQLYNYRDKIVILDDCDKALEDKTSLGLLKAALDSYDSRVLSWMSMRDNDAPNSFEFTGGIIFISNKSQGEIDPTVRGRSINVDLTMTDDEKIERMGGILEHIIPEIPLEYKQDALDLIREKKNVARRLDLRSLISVSKIRNSGKENWKELAEMALVS